MECRDVRDLASSFLSGRLPAGAAHELWMHLEECPSCRAELDAERLRAVLKSAFERAESLRVRPEFVSNLTGKLRARAGSHRRSPARRRLRATLAAAAALAIAVIGYQAHERLGARRFAALARVAAGDHRHCALPFPAGAARMALEEAGRRFGPLFSALSGVTPAPAGRDGHPVTLLERHACAYEGLRFAHILVRYRGQPASVLVPDSGGHREPVSTFLHVEGLSVLSFAASHHLVFVVSPLGREDSQDLVRAFEGPVSQALEGL